MKRLRWRVTIPATTGSHTIILDRTETQFSQDFKLNTPNYNTARFLALSWVSLLSDNPIGPLPSEVYDRFTRSLSHDIKGIIKTYSSLADTLMKSERALDNGTVVRSYIKGMEKTPVYRVYLKWFRTGDPVLLQFLLSMLCFGKKAPFDDPALEKAAFRGWYENEVKLRSVDYNPVALKNLRHIVSWLLEGFKVDVDAFTPHHGPGFTAERVGRGIESKNSSMTVPNRHRRYYASEHSLYPDFQGYYDNSEKAAELTFVPKNYKTMRTICMEPAGMMYIQQGIRDQLYKFFSTSRMALFCHLRDQTYNQVAAREGSYRRQIDTIDLSSASDLVSWRLVKGIFPFPILYDLYFSRSPQVRYKDFFVLEQEKYAPMGSALCFPIQCIVFTAVVIGTGISQVYGLDLCVDPLPSTDVEALFCQAFRKEGEVERHGSQRYASPTIFGDDICLDYRLTSNTMRNLEKLGFIVNVAKSFIGSDTFRESCGKFFSRGFDVSMMKLNVAISGNEEIDIAELAGLVDQANLAYDHGYMNLRRFLVISALYIDVEKLAPQECGRNPILFSNDEDQVLAIRFVPRAGDENRHLRQFRFGTAKIRPLPSKVSEASDSQRRISPIGMTDLGLDYQKSAVQSVGLKPSKEMDHTDGYANYAYLQWQRAQWYGHDDPPVWEGSVRADYRGVVPVLRWTSA